MGFFGRLAHKEAGAWRGQADRAGRLGHKVSHEAHRLAVKVQPIAHKIAGVSGEVSDVAGVVSKTATAALPFTAEIPLVGEAVGGIAAGSKALQIGAGGVSRVAGMIDIGARALR